MSRLARAAVLVAVLFAIAGCAASGSNNTNGSNSTNPDAGDSGLPDGSAGGGNDGSTPPNDGGLSLDGSTCTPKTCADLGVDCGTQSDGCGNTIDCGNCTSPDYCGGGGSSKCGTGPCQKKTCADLGATCGQQGDGCGGLIDCGTCTAPETCGGGGTPNQCGKPACTKKTCAQMGYNCGPVADGCGGLVDCGTCTLPDICGGGGKPNVCGNVAPPCAKKTCADYPSGTCGVQSDGCGGLTANCGSCTAPNVCGGGGTPSVCGGAPPPCTPKTCADFPSGTCGQVSDGCGGLTANCGSCTAPQCCGCGGTPNLCGGAPTCTKKTCADYPSNACGPQSDGCGGLTADCGTCPSGQTCGGAGPGLCGDSSNCINLQCQQVTCSGSATTSISGTVYDPAGLRPLPNVYVYVPNGTPAAFTDGATCDKCSAALTGLPLVTTLTDTNGNFKLDNMPVGNNIPVVIQIGRWRRQITVSTTKCADTAVSALLTHLPQNQSQGDIPLIALSTGGFDSLECLLRKIGISDSEFTNPGGGGRVNLYAGQPQGLGGQQKQYNAPSKYSSGTAFPDAATLWASKASLMRYNVLLMSCEGNTFPTEVDGSPYKTATALQAMYDYVNSGGRVFASHYHYYWLQHGPAPWPSIAQWNPDLIAPATQGQTATESIITSFPKGQSLAQWLMNVGGSTTLGQLSVVQPRDSVKDGTFNSSLATQWVHVANQQWFDYTTTSSNYGYVNINNVPQYFSFNMPFNVASDQQCGRFVFSDIHVSTGDKGTTFPTECKSTGMSPQELALEYMFFDLSSPVCDESQPPPTCTKLTCADQGIECGPAPDGCGGVISSCGTCPSGQVCSTGGKCAGSSCTPTTCSALGKNCGTWSDGCGGTLSCGTCTAPDTCGGSGTPGVCGSGTCTKTTCGQLSKNCGTWPDGCGGTLNCGTCTAPETCGGTGTPGQCGASTCTPLTCADLGPVCGQQGDGCGGTIDCGACSGPTCTPLTCGGRCGPQGDGCGGVIQCPACPTGTCVPTDCTKANAECGSYPDGCGGSLDCGTCSGGAICSSNKCVIVG